MRRLIRDYHVHLLVGTIILLVAALVVGVAGGFAAHDKIVQLYGKHGLVEPPAVAQAPHGVRGGGQRSFGARPPTTKKKPLILAGGVLPASVDLSANNPPVGDQDGVNACVSWTLAYTLRGWYAARDHRPFPGSGAPMYLYSQIVHGQNVGTSVAANAAILMSQGVTPQRDYWQGNDNYTSQPTASERTAASSYRVSGSHDLFVGPHIGPSAQTAIEQALAAGTPVGIMLPIYSSFYNANPGAYYITDSSGTFYGYHEVAATKYDANGLWVQNQWGTAWGLNGWVELSWWFVDTAVVEASVLDMPPPPPTPTVRPTPRPAPHPVRRPLRFRVISAAVYRTRPRVDAPHTFLVRKGWTLEDCGRSTGHWQYAGLLLPRHHCNWIERKHLRRIV